MKSLKRMLVWLVISVFVCPRTMLAASDISWKPLGEPGSGGFVVTVAVNPFDGNRVLVGGDVLGAGLSTDGGDTWQATFGFRSWEFGSFTWDPNNGSKVWAATSSGPYQSSDGGVHWRSMRNGMFVISDFSYSLPLEKILFDPDNGSHLLAFSGLRRRDLCVNFSSIGSVWQSMDGGATWTHLAQLGPTSPGSQIFCGVMAAAYASGGSPRALYAAVDRKGVFKSIDGGATWHSINSGLPSTLSASYVRTDPRHQNLIYASFFSGKNSEGRNVVGGVFKSTNGGASWQSINRGFTQMCCQDGLTSSYPIIEIAPSASNELFTTDLSFSVNVTYRSIDSGAHWTVLNNTTHFYQGATGTAFGLAVDPKDAKRVFATNDTVINRSLDGGNTWRDVTAIEVKRPQWRGTGFSGLVATNIIFDPGSHRVAVMGLDDGKWVESSDDLKTWRRGGGLHPFNGGQDATFSGDTVYATFGQSGFLDGIGKSHDGGQTWTYVTNPIGNNSGNFGGIYALPGNSNKVWVIVNGGLYASTDGGKAWAKVTTGGSSNDGALVYIAAPISSSNTTFFINGHRGIWKTKDGGTSFSLMPSSPTDTSRIIVDPTKSTRLYVTKYRVDSTDGLYRYDGVWTQLPIPTAATDFIQSVTVDPTNANRIVISTDDDPFHDVSSATGIWLSENFGKTWVQRNKGLAVLRGSIVKFIPWRPGQLIFGASGRGFWLGTLQ